MDITAALQELHAGRVADTDRFYAEYVALRDPLKAAYERQRGPIDEAYQLKCDALYKRFGAYAGTKGLPGVLEYQAGRVPSDIRYRGIDPAPAAYRVQGDALFADYMTRLGPITAEYEAASDTLYDVFRDKCWASYDAAAVKKAALNASAAETMSCWSCQRVMLVSDGYGNAPCDDCQDAVKD